MGTGFHSNQRVFHVPEALVNASSVDPESASIDDFAVFVEGAVMASDVSKVDSNRDPNPGPSARTL
jgi:hypothetical protein